MSKDRILSAIKSWFTDDLGYILEPIESYQDLHKISTLADWLTANGGEHSLLAAEVLRRAVEVVGIPPPTEAKLVILDLTRRMQNISLTIDDYLSTVPAHPLPPLEPIPPPTITTKKIGYHVSASSTTTANAVKALKPNVVKVFGFAVTDFNWVNDVVSHCPDTFFVGRFFEPNQFFKDDPALRGRQFAEKILSLPTAHLVDAWESFNEAVPSNAPDDLHKRYDDFQVAFYDRLKQDGLEGVAFNFGTGHGRGQQWLELYPGTLEKYTYLGFHEYDWPYLLHTPGEWLSLRYRRIMNEGIRQTYNDKHIVIITECGVTQGVHGGGDLGWLNKENTIPNRQPNPQMPISEDEYYQSLLDYNIELNKDDYVLGACLFVVGSDSGRWATFEHLPKITQRLEDDFD